MTRLVMPTGRWRRGTLIGSSEATFPHVGDPESRHVVTVVGASHLAARRRAQT